MPRNSRHLVNPLFCGLLALTTPLTAGAQAPPIHGFNATIALPSSVDKFYSDANTILVKTSNGVERVVRAMKDSTVEVASASLDGLQPGRSVLVHYTVKGIQTSAREIERPGRDLPNVNEGTVVSVDRRNKRVAIRLASGAMETLRLARHAVDSSQEEMPSGSYVIVHYLNDAGQRVANYFKPRR